MTAREGNSEGTLLVLRGLLCDYQGEQQVQSQEEHHQFPAGLSGVEPLDDPQSC